MKSKRNVEIFLAFSTQNLLFSNLDFSIMNKRNKRTEKWENPTALQVAKERYEMRMNKMLREERTREKRTKENNSWYSAMRKKDEKMRQMQKAKGIASNAA